MLRKIFATAMVLGGVFVAWQGGVLIWLGLFSLIAGLLVLAKPQPDVKDDPASTAAQENLRHGNPSRDTTRSDYFLHGGPPGGGSGSGDGGAV